MTENKPEPVKTILVITVGLGIIGLVGQLNWLLKVAFLVGLAGIFSDFLANQIHWAWMKIAHVLSLIIPNILLSIIFFFLLWPMAVLSKLFGKSDPLLLKNSKNSFFSERGKLFKPGDFEKPW